VLFIESLENIKLVTAAIKSNFTDEIWGRVIFKDNALLYENEKDFECSHILKNVETMLAPFSAEPVPLRIWSQLVWKEQGDLYLKFLEYECTCDLRMKGQDVFTICAYNSKTSSSSIMLAMMKSHEYIMTDNEIAKSDLYMNQTKFAVVYPSLISQALMQTEMDLYKQKLDFVQVVSHEVRNPLTVIKSYATLLLKENLSTAGKQKSYDIRDYVDVIDHEIAHIINTEQMLTTESLWVKSNIEALAALEKITSISEIKARTQNIKLHKKFSLTGNEQMNSNSIGFRLILSNLLSNAIKYSYEAGNVYIEARALDDQLVIEIWDEGMGMNQAQLGKVFLKYEKMNNDRSGQGIGLFMVKKLVDHFQGEIKIQSLTNEGTQIQVFLPLVKKIG